VDALVEQMHTCSADPLPMVAALVRWWDQDRTAWSIELAVPMVRSIMALATSGMWQQVAMHSLARSAPRLWGKLTEGLDWGRQTWCGESHPLEQNLSSHRL